MSVPGIAPGLIVAAPASGSGKTTLTLALLRHFRNAGLRVASAKVGPDYIDPAFHRIAGGGACNNLDSWAMRPETLMSLIAEAGRDADLLIVEGVMGLFDGAADGSSSTAELAALTGWPVLLAVDARGLSTSAAALLYGFTHYRPKQRPEAVVFNRVGGKRHRQMLEAACKPLGLPILGYVPRDESLALPARHLGLVQAIEHPALESFLETAAGLVARHVDCDALQALARRTTVDADPGETTLPPLGQRIAVASDEAFAFAYPFVLDGWRHAGASLETFSPLADEAPSADCDAVYLPGGYPELHAGRLAGNNGFLGGLRAAAERGAAVYGECGGYMALGERLVDEDGKAYPMAGLLPIATSFAEPRLTLGYRYAVRLEDGPLRRRHQVFCGHEFHYASVLGEEAGEGTLSLFAVSDARGEALGPVGACRGNVCGSFLHLIDRAAPGTYRARRP